MANQKNRKSILKQARPTVDKLIHDLNDHNDLASLHLDPSTESLLLKKIKQSPLKLNNLEEMNLKSMSFSDSSNSLIVNSHVATNVTGSEKYASQKDGILRQSFDRKKPSRGSSGFGSIRKMTDENVLQRAHGITKSEYEIAINALVEEVELLSGQKITDYLQISKVQRLIKNNNEDVVDDVFNYLMPNFNMPHRKYE